MGTAPGLGGANFASFFFFFQVFGSQQPYDPAEMLRSAAAFLSLSCVHGLSPGLCSDSEMEEALR